MKTRRGVRPKAGSYATTCIDGSLDPNAGQRLANIRMVKPELAMAVENYLINAASSGRLNRPLNDNELKQVLLSLQQPKKEFK